MKKSLIGGVAAAALTVLLATPAYAVDAAVIYVPDDFVPALSDTRTAGHYDVVGTGLRIWTDASGTGSPDPRKVAEYVATDTALATVGEPNLEYSRTSGTIDPGFQLVVDFDADGTQDGILVGEPTAPGYGDNWWLNMAAKQFVKDAAPHTGGGLGSTYYGTLDEWRAAFPNAIVTAFGFSLGSGVTGDGVISAINFAGKHYTFADGPKPVVLANKEQCKDGGWKDSTAPVFKNQGQCVSSFVSAKAGK